MLKSRHEKFCRNIANNMDQTEAYLDAGYDCTRATARRSASRLLTNVHIQERIEELRAEIAERHKITADEIVEELRLIAFFDPRLLYDQDGHLLPVHEMPERVARVVASVKEYTLKNGTSVVEVKFNDKIAALVNLGNYVGMFKGKGADAPDLSSLLARIDHNAEQLADIDGNRMGDE